MLGRSLNDAFARTVSGFNPDRFAASRAIGLYSAGITISAREALDVSARLCVDQGVTPAQLYETVLQSYLFLGFPRMLFAAECLHELFPRTPDVTTEKLAASVSAEDWLERGRLLCRKVYDGNYDALKARVESMAPEIFLWMELEGYGKVLSRPGLDTVDREIAIVACLVVEDRKAQLHSHLKGAINVGADPELVRAVIDDLRQVAPDGHDTACQLLLRIGLS